MPIDFHNTISDNTSQRVSIENNTCKWPGNSRSCASKYALFLFFSLSIVDIRSCIQPIPVLEKSYVLANSPCSQRRGKGTRSDRFSQSLVHWIMKVVIAVAVLAVAANIVVRRPHPQASLSSMISDLGQDEFVGPFEIE